MGNASYELFTVVVVVGAGVLERFTNPSRFRACRAMRERGLKFAVECSDSSAISGEDRR